MWYNMNRLLQEVGLKMEEEKKALYLERETAILSRTYNYFARTGMGNNKQKMRNGKAVKLLSTLSLEQAEVLLNTPSVQEAIFNIDNTEILRVIFRKVPAFFQEIMFNNEKVQDYLLTPRRSLGKEELFQSYNTKEIVFKEEEIKELKHFLHSIKSPKIYEQVIESNYFQRIIALCYDKQLANSFFEGMDKEKLFYNIVSDEDIFHTKLSRRKNIVKIFNKVSNHILLPDDYETFINPREFIIHKKFYFQDAEEVIVDKKTLFIMTPDMIRELLEFKNVDLNLIQEFLEEDILENLKIHNFDFCNTLLFLRISFTWGF